VKDVLIESDNVACSTVEILQEICHAQRQQGISIFHYTYTIYIQKKSF